jgi:hypothetical protein
MGAYKDGPRRSFALFPALDLCSPYVASEMTNSNLFQNIQKFPKKKKSKKAKICQKSQKPKKPNLPKKPIFG